MSNKCVQVLYMEVLAKLKCLCFLVSYFPFDLLPLFSTIVLILVCSLLNKIDRWVAFIGSNWFFFLLIIVLLVNQFYFFSFHFYNLSLKICRLIRPVCSIVLLYFYVFSCTITSMFCLFCLIYCFCHLGLCLGNVDLGTACGKYYRVSCLSIIDPGTTNFVMWFIKFHFYVIRWSLSFSP